MNHQKIGYARVSTTDQNLERQLDIPLPNVPQRRSKRSEPPGNTGLLKRPPKTVGCDEKVHLPRTPEKPRTAGRCDREVGACDHLPLS